MARKLNPLKAKKVSLKRVQKSIPTRNQLANKSAGGRVLILAGSRAMPGAACLASKAAARMGCAYIYASQTKVLKFLPEALLWSGKSFDKMTAALIGPGSGLTKSVATQIKRLKKTSLPVVIDADALTIAAKAKLYPFPKNWVATPHPTELGRFLKLSADKINSDRTQAVHLAEKLLGCIVVLKGHNTLVACDGDIFLIPTGNVALAKAGSGDVLAGMITGLMAQGCDSLEASLLGCYFHGWLADQWIKNRNDYLSLTPSDLIDAIPKALFDFRKK